MPPLLTPAEIEALRQDKREAVARLRELSRPPPP